MKTFFNKFGHLFSNLGHDVHVIMMVMSHIFSNTEVQAAVDYLATAGINYANHEFENAQTRSFVSNSLIKLGMSENFAHLLTAHVMTIAEKKVDGLLEKLHEHLTTENNTSAPKVVTLVGPGAS